MKKERATSGRLYWVSYFLAVENNATGEYPYDLQCYQDRGYRTKDGQGNTLIYECIDDGKDYILFSVGKDGIPYTDDDVHAKKHSRSSGY